MNAEIIAVGTEILLGQIVNTNATHLSNFLTDLGFDLYYQQVVGDNRERLLGALNQASSRSDVIVLCGGLGPTEDDLTKQVTAEFLGKKVVYDDEAMARLEAYFTPQNKPVTTNNKRQALTIEGGTTIQNPAGLACGVLYTKGDTTYILVPGPPREMKAMVETEVKPLLEPLVPNQTKLVSRYLNFIGIGESRLAADLDDMIQHQTNPTIASYAKPSEVMLRISAKSDTIKEANQLLDKMEQQIMKSHGEYFYGFGEHLTMEEVVVPLLKENNQTLSIVEGVTGGLCSSRLTDIEGSSDVFYGSIVAYTKKSKLKLLNLEEAKKDSLIMGEEQAKQLALTIKKITGTDYGLSIIGVAGEESVDGNVKGTIYLGLAKENGVIVKKLMINRERDYIKDGAVKHGLNLLRKSLR